MTHPAKMRGPSGPRIFGNFQPFEDEPQEPHELQRLQPQELQRLHPQELEVLLLPVDVPATVPL